MAKYGPRPKTDAERIGRLLIARSRASAKRKQKTDLLRGDPDFWAHKAHISARTRARNRGILFDITEADVRALHRPTCQCCGGSLAYNAKLGRCGPAWDSASIDRLKPELGYVPGNLGLVCTGCNTIKGNAKNDPQWLRMVADYIERP